MIAEMNQFLNNKAEKKPYVALEKFFGIDSGQRPAGIDQAFKNVSKNS